MSQKRQLVFGKLVNWFLSWIMSLNPKAFMAPHSKKKKKIVVLIVPVKYESMP